MIGAMSSIIRSENAVAGLELRYLLTVLLIEAGRRVSLAELVRWVEGDGFTLAGRPSKTVSDALRWEIAKGRVLRCGRGIYVTGSMPRQTKSRIRARVDRMRCELVAEKRDAPVLTYTAGGLT